MTKTATRFPNFNQTQSAFDFKAVQNLSNPTKITNVELVANTNLNNEQIVKNNDNDDA